MRFPRRSPGEVARYQQRLAKIAEILEAIDLRCAAADGPVTPTRQEITDDELRTIYKLAKGIK